MPPQKEPSEADIIFNRANVALARSQRLIQSWLPPKSAEEIANAKSEEELLKEDEELFKPTPELLGLGAPLPLDDQDSLLKGRPRLSNDRLLEQLLGKKAAQGHRATKARAANASRGRPQDAQHGMTTPLAAPAPAQESDDEEESRASLVSSKASRRKRPLATAPTTNTQSATQQDTATGDSKPDAQKDHVQQDNDEDDARPVKKRVMSYMDQILAEKANKKKKKSKA